MNYSLIFLFTFYTLAAHASNPKAVDEKLILIRLNDLVETIINFEKEHLHVIETKFKEIKEKTHQEITKTIDGAKQNLKTIHINTTEKLENVIKKNKKGNAKCLEHHHPKMDATLSKGEGNLKNCSEKKLKEAKSYHDSVQQNIASVKKFIAEMEKIIASCTSSKDNSTKCVIDRSQNSKNKISLAITESRDNLQKALNHLAITTQSIHQCSKRTLHSALKEFREIEKKVESCIHRPKK